MHPWVLKSGQKFKRKQHFFQHSFKISLPIYFVIIKRKLLSLQWRTLAGINLTKYNRYFFLKKINPLFLIVNIILAICGKVQSDPALCCSDSPSSPAPVQHWEVKTGSRWHVLPDLFASGLLYTQCPGDPSCSFCSFYDPTIRFLENCFLSQYKT